jgi:DOPA 4,5-dioxygenase
LLKNFHILEGLFCTIGKAGMMSVALIKEITTYHAHIYFKDAAERAAAMVVREQIAERFAVRMGRVHEQPVGPHELPMYQVAFAPAGFAGLVPWLMLNRAGLTILVHPNTGNARRDHLVNACWLGAVLRIMRPELLPESRDSDIDDEIILNTNPKIVY